LKKRIKIKITPKKSRYQLDKEIGIEYRKSSENGTYTNFKKQWLKENKLKI